MKDVVDECEPVLAIVAIKDHLWGNDETRFVVHDQHKLEQFEERMGRKYNEGKWLDGSIIFALESSSDKIGAYELFGVLNEIGTNGANRYCGFLNATTIQSIETHNGVMVVRFDCESG